MKITNIIHKIAAIYTAVAYATQAPRQGPIKSCRIHQNIKLLLMTRKCNIRPTICISRNVPDAWKCCCLGSQAQTSGFVY